MPEYGSTALHVAAVWGHTDVTTLLLDRGANVNLPDGVGWTALMRAAVWGQKEMVRLLLLRGADVNSRDQRGKAVLDYVTDKEIYSILSTYKAA
eukprot:gene526-562_t